MINIITKSIATLFLFVVSVIVFFLWLSFGTIMLIALLLRLISLYTISLLTSFISGTQPKQDYIHAIEASIDTYISRFVKIINMPRLPWLPLQPDAITEVGQILQLELETIKKNWIISIAVFLSYIISAGSSTAFIIYKTNGLNSFSERRSEKNIELKHRIEDLQTEIIKNHKERNATINELYYKYHISTPCISDAFEISKDSIIYITEN
jgi:hypothetical protein